MTNIKTSLMMKTWAVSLLLLVSLIASPIYAATPEWTKSVLKLEIEELKQLQGSGTVLRIVRTSNNVTGGVKWETYILTNAHNTYKVVLIPIGVNINQTKTKTMYQKKHVSTPIYVDGIETEILKVDKEIDLALLKLTTTVLPKYTSVVISTAALDVADWVISIGFPGGYGPMITGGYVSVEACGSPAVSGCSDDDRPELFLHSANTARGNSGGAVFRNKKLVGISARVGVHRGVQIFHVAFAIRMEHILDFLKGFEHLLTIVDEK